MEEGQKNVVLRAQRLTIDAKERKQIEVLTFVDVLVALPFLRRSEPVQRKEEVAIDSLAALLA